MTRAAPLERALKRMIDVVLATLALAALAPAMAGIATAILLTGGRPVLFRQQRTGYRGAAWPMWKFRTMRPLLPDEDQWRVDDVRTARLGRFLRRTSLDELPQLFHVVSGRMSLVGPRPLPSEFSGRYSPHHSRRHDVKPGITGLAQVSGRSSLTFGQRLDLDIQYVDRWSLWLDLSILLRTAAAPFQQGYVPGQSVEDVDDVGLFLDAR